MKQLGLFISICILMGACVSEYEPNYENQLEGLLVVDGTITSGETIIKLSRSIAMSEKFSGKEYVNNAKLSVENDKGIVISNSQLRDSGEYVINVGELDVSSKYRLNIMIADDIYQSEYLSPLIIPEIDSISWQKKGEGEPLYIPQLTRAEVNQYLACLLLRETLTENQFKEILSIIYTLAPNQDFSMEQISDKAPDIAESCKKDMALARQISSVLAPSINGNPRQCKRFLNTLYMRLKLAKARNVALDKNILAKLMLAEYFNPEFFKAVTKPENRELFKAFEKGEELNDDNPFAVWKEKDWVKKWMQNGTRLDEEKLDKYVYFADVKNRYGQSSLDMLSPTARKCYEQLVDGTEMNRNAALKLVDKLVPGEKAIIASEVFAVIENTSTINVEVLRSYTEFCIKAGMTEDALKKLMEQPVSKYNAVACGQLASFISNLSPDKATMFNDYLSTNPELKSTIERQARLNSIVSSNKK